MTDPGDDRDLREAFGAARARDHAIAPRFADLVRRGRRPDKTRRRGLAVVAVALAIAALAGISVRSRRESPIAHPAVSVVNWRGPTDFLLTTPGSDLLGAVPSIGRGFDVDVTGGRVSPRPSERGPS